MTRPLGPDHGEWDALAVGWALSALDRRDQDRFSEHLSGCARCIATVREALHTVADLAYVLPDETPPRRLRRRIMDAAAAEPRAAAPDPLDASGAAHRDGLAAAAQDGPHDGPAAARLDGLPAAQDGPPDGPAAGGREGSVPGRGGGLAAGGRDGLLPGPGDGVVGGGREGLMSGPGDGPAAVGRGGSVPGRGDGVPGGGRDGLLSGPGDGPAAVGEGVVPGRGDGLAAGGRDGLLSGPGDGVAGGGREGSVAGRGDGPPAGGRDGLLPGPGDGTAAGRSEVAGRGAGGRPGDAGEGRAVVPIRSRRRIGPAAAAIAAMLALIVGLVAWNVKLHSDQDRLQSIVAQRDELVARLTEAGPARIAIIRGPAGTGDRSATVVVKQGRIGLITETLPPQPADRTYWLWSLRNLRDPDPVPLANFAVPASRLSACNIEPPPGVDPDRAFAISTEPASIPPTTPTKVVAYGTTTSN